MSLSPALPVRPHHKGRKGRILVVILLVLLGGAIGVTLRLRQDAVRVARLHTIVGNSDSTADIVFAPSGRLLFSCDWKGSIYAWKLPQGKLFARLGTRGRAVNTLAISRDGAQLAAGDDGGIVQRWEIASGRGLPALNVGASVRQIAFAPGGEEIALVVHGTDAVLRFDARTGEARGRFTALKEVIAIAYTPDGNFLVAADEQGIRVWDRKSERLIRTLSEARVDNLAVSPDSTRLVVSGLYRRASVYEVATGKAACHFPVAQGGSLAFFSDSRHLLLGHGSDVSVCDTTTGTVAPSLTPPLLLGYTPTFLMRIFPYLRRYQQLPIQKVTLSPDGQTIALSIQDTIILLPLSENSPETTSAALVPARR